MTNPHLIAIDWGTTSLRAYLLGSDAAVIERRAEPRGIMQVSDDDFAGAFDAVVGEWRTRWIDVPAIACGMVGSAQGWVHAPYCPCPAGVDELAAELVSVPERALYVVPGLSRGGDAPDVMRGEETQIVGALARRPELAEDARVVLPGTHAKWARVADARVLDFTTYVTGELFAVLRDHSILGRPALDAARPSPRDAAAAFARGVEAARASHGGLAPLLFSTRSLVLDGRLTAGVSVEYLSGLLVGDEIRCALDAGPPPRALVGDAALCERYTVALRLFGVPDVPRIDDAAPAGLWRVAQAAGLVTAP